MSPIGIRRILLCFMSGVILSGCKLTKPESAPSPGVVQVGGTEGTLDQNRCSLEVTIVVRPIDDPIVTEQIWTIADEQVIESGTREALAANGLRVGRVSGELPAEMEAVFAEAPGTRQKPEPLLISIGSGENAQIDLGAMSKELHLLIDRHGAVGGRDYSDANGKLRLSVRKSADASLIVGLLPEMHHGPIQQGWSVSPSGSTFAPQQLVMRNGQEVEAFRELSTTVSVAPGQLVVMTGRPRMNSSLGRFLFCRGETGDGGESIAVVFIRMSRTPIVRDSSIHRAN